MRWEPDEPVHIVTYDADDLIDRDRQDQIEFISVEEYDRIVLEERRQERALAAKHLAEARKHEKIDPWN